eukprot:gb/GECG01016587.1/.p1 GENE.gb/GECG01016587.1/~~gb/GECG01016587.1/.p1  ORF type:complete len:265 (+),score=32.19 gb/GECG01016587.1/:1-795(+)
MRGLREHRRHYGVFHTLLLFLVVYLCSRAARGQPMAPTLRPNGTGIMAVDPDRPRVHAEYVELVAEEPQNITVSDVLEDPPPTLEWSALRSNVSAAPPPLHTCTYKLHTQKVLPMHCAQVEENDIVDAWDVYGDYDEDDNKTDFEVSRSLIVELYSSLNVSVLLDIRFSNASNDGNTTKTGDGGSSNSASTGVVVGSVLGSAAGLGLIMGICCCCKRGSGGNKAESLVALPEKSVNNPVQGSVQGTTEGGEPGIMENGIAEAWL